MNKRDFLVLILGALLVAILAPVSATCTLDAELVNQDPYPAIPGDSVDVVFQLSGVSNPECNGAVFDLVLSYPFSLDGEQNTQRVLSGGTYVRDYKKEWVLPYTLRVDDDTLDGDRELEVRYKSGATGAGFLSEKFNITVEEVRVDFELSVKDYDPSTNEITFEILNIGEQDIEALTIDVQKQDNLTLRGSPRVIVGSLDSNEEETFRIKAEPTRGFLNLQVTYTDKVNTRRTLEKSVFFEPDYFQVEKQGNAGIIGYIVIAGIGVGIYFWARKKKREKKHNVHQSHK